MVAPTRRAVLVAAPALLLSACGKAAEPQQEDPNVDTGTQKQGDVDLLRGLLEAEVPIGIGDGRARRLTEAMAADAQAHREALQQAIRALGGKPGTEQAPVADEPFGATAALTATQQAVALYLDFVPKLSDGRVRRLAAGILADRAAELAQLRLLAGDEPVPEAFVT